MTHQNTPAARRPGRASALHAHAVLAAVVLAAALLVTGCASTPVRMSQASDTEEANRALVARAFEGWARGEVNFFDLLTDDVRWTIAGRSRFSRTYEGKRAFTDETVTPFTSRLASPIVPTVRALYADGDVVVAVWDGAATAADGEPYRNSYSWAMTLRDGRITEVTAFLDLQAYEAVIDRVPAAR